MRKCAVPVLLAAILCGVPPSILSAASYKFKSTWKAPGAGPLNFAGKKVAALVITNDDNLRVSAEEALKREISARGPVGVAAYTLVPKEELREVGAGDLVLTNHRLLFIGAHTFAIPFARLLRCEQVDAGLVVSESRWKNPRVLLPENPALWYFLVNLVANNQFEGPRLPDDMHISVTGEVPKLRIEILDRGPIKRGILGSPARTRLP